MELLPVVALVGGTVCLYGAIKNKNPIGVITAALTGRDLADVAPLMSGGASGDSPVDTGQADPKGINLPGTVPSADAPKGDPRVGAAAGKVDSPVMNNPLIPDWLERLFPQPKSGVLPNYGNGTANGGVTPGGNGAV